MSDAASSAAVPTATSEAPGYAVGKVLAGETRSLTTLRAEARKRNGHAQDPHADGLVLLEQVRHSTANSRITDASAVTDCSSRRLCVT